MDQSQVEIDEFPLEEHSLTGSYPGISEQGHGIGSIAGMRVFGDLLNDLPKFGPRY
jgi:hypothetical protein